MQYYGSLSTLFGSQGILAPGTICGVWPHDLNQATYNFSFGVQREIGFKTVLDVAYVGALGRHLLQASTSIAYSPGSRLITLGGENG